MGAAADQSSFSDGRLSDKNLVFHEHGIWSGLPEGIGKRVLHALDRKENKIPLEKPEKIYQASDGIMGKYMEAHSKALSDKRENSFDKR